jgi:hypothetical protein
MASVRRALGSRCASTTPYVDSATWRKSDIGGTIPATRNQRKTLASIALRSMASLACARMVGPRSFVPFASYPASSSTPCPSPCALIGRNGSWEREPSAPLSWIWTSWRSWCSERQGAREHQGSVVEEEDEGEVHWQQTDSDRCPKIFIGLGHGPTIHFASALTPCSFPTHDPCGNCPTTSHVSRHVQESRHRGRTPELVHDPSGQQSTQVLLFWHRDRSGNVTSHIKCDRSCRSACALLLGRTQAIGGSVARARPGATVSALGLGDPSTYRSAHSKR